MLSVPGQTTDAHEEEICQQPGREPRAASQNFSSSYPFGLPQAGLPAWGGSPEASQGGCWSWGQAPESHIQD